MKIATVCAAVFSILCFAGLAAALIRADLGALQQSEDAANDLN